MPLLLKTFKENALMISHHCRRLVGLTNRFLEMRPMLTKAIVGAFLCDCSDCKILCRKNCYPSLLRYDSR